MDLFPRIPPELKALPQWVLWTYENDTKVPKNPATLGNAGVNWRNTWSSYDVALRQGSSRNLGIGFVLTPSDPYVCVDLDKCVRKGQVGERTRGILDLLKGYVELSPSLNGLHLWIRSEKPLNRRTEGLEVYSSSRFITMTGRANPNAPKVIPDRTNELLELARRYFPENPHSSYTPQEVPVEDEEIWRRLFNSKNGATFQSLFNGDISVTHNDHSRAVIFLANMLAMMTGGDAARIKSLLYQTGLRSDKWDHKRGNRTWLDLQIEDAIQWSRGRKKF